jgi:hypothetical protein
MTYWIPMTDDDWVNTGKVPEKKTAEETTE